MLRDIILKNDPKLFLEVFQIARELIPVDWLGIPGIRRLFSNVDVPLPGISNRLMRSIGFGYKSETLIEAVLRLIAQKLTDSPLEELNGLQRVLRCCFLNSTPIRGLDHWENPLTDFLLHASPELINLFFVQISSMIRNGILSREIRLDIFNRMIQVDFIDEAMSNNRISVLKGLKKLGYDLSSLRGSSIHCLAGSATIATAAFLLEEGTNINAEDQMNRKVTWYIIHNIHCISNDLLNFSESDSSCNRFMLDNINKILFVLQNGAEMTEDEAKKLDAAVALFSGKIYKNKQKYTEIPMEKLQYLRGIVKEKLGNPQQASYHFIDAATQGHKAASLKMAEYSLSIKKEEDALIWYQQAINNSAAPKSTLLHLIGLEKMIQLAHGISFRKTEASVNVLREYAIIMRELRDVDYSQQTISIDGLLQLAHLAIEEDASPEYYKFALKLTCAAFDKAISEDKTCLALVQQDIQHVMNNVLYQLPEEEAKHYAGIHFMPSPSECGIAHYYRLCLELAQVNLDMSLLNENCQQQAKYWVEMATILGHKDQAVFSENLRESIDKELHNIASVIPDLVEEKSRNLTQVARLGF